MSSKEIHIFLENYFLSIRPQVVENFQVWFMKFSNEEYKYLTTITVELGFLWDFVLFKLKTCSLYHENLFIQKFKVISSQVLNNFFSASDT